MSAAPGDFYIPAADTDAARILAMWGWFLRHPYRLLGVSAFGDLFLEDGDASIKMLDLVACELKEIATCIEEFDWGLGDPAHQEKWLMAGPCRLGSTDLLRRAREVATAGSEFAARNPGRSQTE